MLEISSYLRYLCIGLLFYILFSSHFLFVKCTENILRGVPLARHPLYETTKEFQCLEGAQIIPSHFVNDDYCDCPDGTDEPGTSACPNGVFHCLNKGHTPKNIPSSRVNDGICDCCDGSDEYSSLASCSDTCFQLGQKAREEAEKQQELYLKGYTLYQGLVQQGQNILNTHKERLQILKEEEKQAEQIKSEKEAIKNELEAREKQALEKYESEKEAKKKEQEELEMKKHLEEERQNAENAFRVLDQNEDGMLSYKELQQFPQFDSDKDGTVSEDEAKFFLHMKDEMALDEFVLTGWMIMKPIYTKEVDQAEPTPPSPPPSEPEREEELKHLPDPTEEPDEGEEEEEEEDDLAPPDFPTKEEEDYHEEDKKEESSAPQYDPETQKLVDDAGAARREFSESAEKLRKIQDEVREIEGTLDADFGPSGEFLVLKGQCFEFDDREYTYKLCPFDSASQNPKHGGSSINLGRWGHWSGPEGNKYSAMRYENGIVCWNGPPRSVTVKLSCGLENQLTSTTEPNRCEYHMDFTTPAMCSLPPPPLQQETPHPHLEL